MKQQPPRKIQIKVGCFVILAVVLSLSLLIYIGVKKDLFSERISYYVISKTGEGIEPGIPVKLQGFEIGQVVDVNLVTLNVVRTRIRVLKKYMKYFTADSTVSLEQPIIGGGFVKLVAGSADSPVLEADSEITMKESVDLQAQLQEEVEAMLKEINEVVTNARLISEEIISDDGPVMATLNNLEHVSERLADDDGLLAYLSAPEPARRVDNILANTESSSENLNKLLVDADKRVEDLAPIQQELVQLIKDVRMIVAEFQDISDRVIPILEDAKDVSGEVKNATTDLKGLRRRSEYTLHLGTKVLQRLNETWPLARSEEPGPQSHPQATTPAP